MITQQGLALHADADSVRVRVGPSPVCAACASGRGCGAGLFGRLLRRAPVELSVPNTIGAVAGQVVNVGMAESLYLSLLARLYLLPLTAGLAGALIGHHMASDLHAFTGWEDVAAAIGAILLGSAALLGTRRRLERAVRNGPLVLVSAGDVQHCAAGAPQNPAG